MKAMTAIAARKEKGFTLIELVMVIVILGILAAFALPRFADLGEEAESASVQGARGAVKSVIGIVRSTALAQGKGSETTLASPAGDGSDLVVLEGENINLVNGHLAAASVEDAAQLGDFLIKPDTPASPLYITVSDAQDNSPCFTFTNEATSGTATVSSVTNNWSTADSDCTP